MRVDGATKSILHGVSTLPAPMQPPGFAKEQKNFRANKHLGLTRRQGLDFLPIEKLDGSPDDILIDDRDTVEFVTIGGIDYWLVLRLNKPFLLIDTQGRSQAVTDEVVSYVGTNMSVASSNNIAIVASADAMPSMNTAILRPNGVVSMIHCIEALVEFESISVQYRYGADETVDRSAVTVDHEPNQSVVTLASRIVEAINTDPNQGGEIFAVFDNACVTLQRTALCPFDDYTDVVIVGSTGVIPINGVVNNISHLPASGPYLEIVELASEENDTGMYLRLEGVEATDPGEEPPVDPPPVGDDVIITFTNGTRFDADIARSEGDNAVRGRMWGHLTNETDSIIRGIIEVTPRLVNGGELEGAILGLEYQRNIQGAQLHFRTRPTSPPVTATVNGTRDGPGGAGSQAGSWPGIYVEDTSPNYLHTVYNFVPDDGGIIGTGSDSYQEINTITVQFGAGVSLLGESAPPRILSGVWRETSKPGEPYQVLPNTFPHILQFSEGAWRIGVPEGVFDRRAGNEDNNPLPFKGPVKDIAFAQNRLITASGADIVMSQTANYANYFQQTMAQLVSTDPISVSHTSTRDKNIEYLVPHTGGVTAFNEVGQYKVAGDTALEPATASLPHIGTYSYYANCKPVSGGQSILFPNTFGITSGINLMGVKDGRDLVETIAPLTDQCAKYIQGDVEYIAREPVLDVIVVKVFGSNTLYIGEMAGEVMAWSEHEIGGDADLVIQNIAFGETALQVLFTLGGDASLGEIKYTSQITQDVYLDYKYSEEAVNTVVTLPVGYPEDTPVVTIQGEGCPFPGEEVANTRTTNILTLDEDMEGGKVYYGLPFESTYIPAQIQVRDAGGYSQSGAKLRINNFTAQLYETGTVNADIISNFYDFPTQEFHSSLYTDFETVLDDPNINSQEFLISYKQPTELAYLKLFTNHHTPVTITSLEWSGAYIKRGRRF